MAAFFKALDVTPLIRLSRKRGNTFNMLLCRRIGKAAGEVGDLYLFPVGQELWQSLCIRSFPQAGPEPPAAL